MASTSAGAPFPHAVLFVCALRERERGMMDVMNATEAAASAALCVLCQQGVDNVAPELWSPSPPLQSLPPLLLLLLHSILTWSMISASLLPPPVPSHGTRSPAASLVPFLFLVQYSQQQSDPALLTQARQPGSRLLLLLRLSTEA